MRDKMSFICIIVQLLWTEASIVKKMLFIRQSLNVWCTQRL